MAVAPIDVGSSGSGNDAQLQLLPLLFDQHGWLEGRHAAGNDCLYYRNAPNTTDSDELRSMLKEVRDREARSRIPTSRRLFPDGTLKSRPCYIFNLGLISSRWELRIKDGRELQAKMRCERGGLSLPANHGGLVMFRISEKLLRSDAQSLLSCKKRLGLDPKLQPLPPMPQGVGPAATELQEEDEDFFVKEELQQEMQSYLRSALQTVIQCAQAEGAALIYADYNLYDAPKMFASIVESCNLTGPIVAVDVDESVVVQCDGPVPQPDLVLGGAMEKVGGMSVICRGATHAFLIEGDHGYSRGGFTQAHSKLAHALALAISGRDTAACTDSCAPSCSLWHQNVQTICGVISNGGKGVLHLMAEGVRQGVP